MAQLKYVNDGKKVKKDKDNFIYLKDVYATKILRDERNREYLMRIICAALDIDLDDMKEDFEIVDIRLGLSNQNVQSEADIVARNEIDYYNVEVNFSYDDTVDSKNLSYICALVLRQLRGKAKEAYRNLKPIVQINLNSYDIFGDNELMYSSKLKEEKTNKVRSELLRVVDINLDFLNKLDYTNISKCGDSSLEKLLYVFVCNDKTILNKIYEGDLVMEEIKNQLFDLDAAIDDVLFYDKEEFRKEVLFSSGKREGFEEGRKEGRAEGREEGREEGKIELIANMSKHMTIEEIHKATYIPLKKIEEILKSINETASKKD